jgi:hypothetical protein
LLGTIILADGQRFPYQHARITKYFAISNPLDKDNFLSDNQFYSFPDKKGREGRAGEGEFTKVIVDFHINMPGE